MRYAARPLVVLVDTSVWIRFLAGKEPYASRLEGLLASYKAMFQAATLAPVEVVEFARYRGINGRGIGWTDAHLLASAIVEHATLWTADRPLEAIARDIGVAYSGTS
jgi:predicted nucleic acid-binding protein